MENNELELKKTYKPVIDDALVETVMKDYEKGQRKGFDVLLRKQVGKLAWDKMTKEEKLQETKEAIYKDLLLMRKDIVSNPGKELNMLLDRALDPIDPFSEVYKEWFKHNGGTVLENGAIKLPEGMNKEVLKEKASSELEWKKSFKEIIPLDERTKIALLKEEFNKVHERSKDQNVLEL